MSDAATPNLPSRDLASTAAFYARLGFVVAHRDATWLVLRRGTLALEFFPHPDLKPEESWFSCCLRLDDLDGFYRGAQDAGLCAAADGLPRLQLPEERDGLRIGALLDPDGSLLRLIQN